MVRSPQLSSGRHPWDRRGDVYVRFGEPDYRSRSDMMNVDQSLAVQRVKERLARAIYGTSVPAKYFLKPAEDAKGIRHIAGDYKLQTSPFESIYPGPVYPVQSLRQSLGEGPEFSAELKDDPGSNTHASDALPPTNYRPVSSEEDASMVAWETWVYVDVGGGIEITFTDEFQNGIYDYAPSPSDARIPVRQQASLNRYNPRTVTAQAASATPNYYQFEANEDPFTFYYDLADFRRDDRSSLEVYLGVPHVTGHYRQEANETRIEIERTVALLNRQTGEIYRRDGQLTFENDARPYREARRLRTGYDSSGHSAGALSDGGGGKGPIVPESGQISSGGNRRTVRKARLTDQRPATRLAH